VDTLVNNAGGSFESPLESISSNGWDAVIDLNLKGIVNCTQIIGGQMRDEGNGNIVNIASVAGLDESPYMSHYGAAKSAIINLTNTLSFEWAPYNIRINAIAPGVIDSGGNVQASIDDTEIDREKVNRNVGLPEEVADVVQFLASPASSYVTGRTIPVAGVPRFDKEHRANEQ
jgi:NAD(P)-dependent dehydrogenase (short-subunit alcohol dehydrogenase family)